MLDGLQALMRADFNQVDVVVGRNVPVSGAMPLDAKDHTQIRSSIEGNADLHFKALTSFKGFWFGVPMWRGELEAGLAAAPGRALLTIHDMVPAKNVDKNATIMVQNPTQIYSVNVWSTERELQAAHLSLGRRLTGYSGLVLAGCAALAAIGLGVLHSFRYHRVQRALAARRIFFLLTVFKCAEGFRAAFSPEGREKELRAGQDVELIDMRGRVLGRGVLKECGPKKYAALFPPEAGMPDHKLLLHIPPA